MATLAKRIGQLQRGLARGSFSASHQARARAELGKLQGRLKTQRLDRTLYNPQAVLSGSRLRGAVNSLIAGEVAPLKRQQGAIDAQANANVAQVGSLFRDLATSQAAAAQRAQTASAQGVQTQQNIATQQNTALEGIATKADAALGGPDNPYTQGARAQLANLVAQQKGAAVASQTAQQTASAQLGQNSEQLVNAMGASNAMRGPELGAQILSTAAAAKTELGGKIADIRGAGRTDLIQKMIAGERNYQAAAKTFGLAVDKQAEVVKQNRRSYQIAHGKLVEDRKHNRITEKQLGQRLLIEQQNADTAKTKAYWTNKVNAWKLAHPNIPLGGRAGKGGKGGGGASNATPLQRRSNYNNFAKVVDYVSKNPGAAPSDFGAPSVKDPLLYKIANDPAYKKSGKIPRKYYAALHTRFPGILTKGK